jgi:predicted O-methyltransferase YrrM
MKERAKNLLRPLLKTHVWARYIWLASLYEYMEETGWFKSAEAQMPFDKNGDYLPWFTYSMISFLKTRVKPEMTVFEFGSGNSTLWWARETAFVTSVEHSFEWYSSLQPKIPSNVNYIYYESAAGGDYCQMALKQDDKFDIIVIDGEDRINCAMNSIQALKNDGVIIWDNSDRPAYQDGFSYLNQNQFKRIDFYGLGPFSKSNSCTSVFYRSFNCFDI